MKTRIAAAMPDSSNMRFLFPFPVTESTFPDKRKKPRRNSYDLYEYFMQWQPDYLGFHFRLAALCPCLSTSLPFTCF
jgi:hypothetical protein